MPLPTDRNSVAAAEEGRITYIDRTFHLDRAHRTHRNSHVDQDNQPYRASFMTCATHIEPESSANNDKEKDKDKDTHTNRDSRINRTSYISRANYIGRPRYTAGASYFSQASYIGRPRYIRGASYIGQALVSRWSATSVSAPPSEKELAVQAPKKGWSFWLSFLALNTTVLIVSLDGTALAVAIPRITNELHGSTLEAFWTNISFILAQTVMQPIWTTTSDILGRKIPLYTAFFLFFIGSIVFAVAKSMSVLIVGRILQGFGGGGLDVLGEIILVDMTTLQERPLYLGLFALPMAAGGVGGPLFGAALSDYVDWRWLGYINLPMVAFGVILTFFFMRLKPIESSFSSKLARLDWIGMFLFMTGCTLFALPLSWAGAMYPWGSWKTIVPLILGILILVFFGWYESRPSDPVMPYRIFSNRTATVTLIGAACQGALLYSTMMYAPMFFQAVRLESAFHSAVSVLPSGCFVIAASIIGVVTIEIFRCYRPIVIASHLLMAVGVGLWALWKVNSEDALLYGLQIIPSIGIGTLFMALNIPMTASMEDPNDMGLASGILVSFRLFGALVGLAVCSTVFNSVMESQISGITMIPPPLDMLHDVKEAISVIPLLKMAQDEISYVLLYPILDAYRKAIMAVFLTLSGIAVLGFIASWFQRELSIERAELGRQAMEADEK